jgi:hypothetical protein
MFTDNPVIPTRLETLIDLLRGLGSRKVSRAALCQLLQPEGLPGVTASSNQANDTVKAAMELGLVEDSQGRIKLLFGANDNRTTRRIILDALDIRVLSSTEVEDYFALFYSYLLYTDEPGATIKSGDEWARDFERDVFGGQRPNNPFNNDKYRALRRWMRYAGLGWHDSEDVFQPNPYERLLRRLPAIFANKKKLTGEAFMASLASDCPELDGGSIFKQANRQYDPKSKACTLGLSHALIDLHFDGVIRLHCAQDSRGWNIESAEPPNDGKTMQSGRIDLIELVKDKY